MFIRAELKERAKFNLKRNLWVTIGTSLVAILLANSSTFGGLTLDLQTGTYYFNIGLGSFGDISFNFINVPIPLALVGVIGIIGFLYNIFVGNVIKVGECRYFIENREAPAKFEVLFEMFKKGQYFNVVKVMLLKDIYLILWTLLFIIPGIYKVYQYYMIPYILAENPEMDSADVFAMTKLLTKNCKLEIFILELSFFLWCLLIPLTCGLAYFYVIPYINSTFAECYVFLRNRAIDNGDIVPENNSSEEEVEVEHVEPTIEDLH